MVGHSGGTVGFPASLAVMPELGTATVLLLNQNGFDQDIATSLLFFDPQPAGWDAVSVAAFGLTPREAEVALHLAERRTNREIAKRLVISPNTVRHHTERGLGTLGMRSRRDVAQRIEEAARLP